jgi:hypothetical protein
MSMVTNCFFLVIRLINMKILVQLLKKMDKIIELLTAEKEHREEIEMEKVREEKEKMLMEYAQKHKRGLPVMGVMTSNELRDKPIEGVTDCVPYGLSDRQKEELRFFYKGSDNREK